MPRSLPYPGHSWSLSQHAIAFSPKTLYQFLLCVAPFEGESKKDEYGKKITKLMIAYGILTANERDGTPDAWRDYQQVLAELGLIYSTKICPILTITELGQMFLAGEIGFSELIGIQSLRYQYPNGQKNIIQKRLKEELGAASISCPSTLIELQVQQQLLLKPGLLILRVLIELFKAGENPSLSVAECQNFLLPCKNNSEWVDALAEVVKFRSSKFSINNSAAGLRRNFQDWFKLLEKSDYFVREGDTLSLSSWAIENLATLESFCTSQEDPANFWIPTKYDNHSCLEWFQWFGSVSFNAQQILRIDAEKDIEYVKENFVAGLEEELDEDAAFTVDNADLNLKPIDFKHLARDTPLNFSGDIEALVESQRQGAQKRHAKTLLHDRIIKELAEKFVSQGARVESDSDSVDLMASWPQGGSAIFEVKTVTRRSIQSRLRSAIGQVEEYAYRRQSAGNPLPDRVIVVNAMIGAEAWQRSFLTDHLGIGLICRPATSYSAYAPLNSITKNHWLSVT